MQKFAWLLFAVMGCGDDGATAPDAMIDAPASACPPKTAPLAPGTHKVFLNFDGVTLTKGNDDAPANVSSLLINDPTTIPMWGPTLSASTRQGRIDAIVDYVTRAMAPYSVDFVTTRPAAGPYIMMVLGGKSQDIGFPTGFAGVAPQTCFVKPNAVTLDFDVDGFTATNYATDILSDLGVVSALGASTRHNDCLNRSDAIDPGIVCSFDAMSTTVAGAGNCGHTPTQDEPQLLKDALGCRD